MNKLEMIKNEIINEIENQKELNYFKLIDFEALKNKVNHLEYLLMKRAYLTEKYRAYLLPENAIKNVLKKYMVDKDCECNSKFYTEIKEFVLNKKGWALNDVLNIENLIKLEINK